MLVTWVATCLPARSLLACHSTVVPWLLAHALRILWGGCESQETTLIYFFTINVVRVAHSSLPFARCPGHSIWWSQEEVVLTSKSSLLRSVPARAGTVRFHAEETHPFARSSQGKHPLFFAKVISFSCLYRQCLQMFWKQQCGW